MFHKDSVDQVTQTQLKIFQTEIYGLMIIKSKNAAIHFHYLKFLNERSNMIRLFALLPPIAYAQVKIGCDRFSNQ